MESQKVFSLTSSLCVIVHNCIHLCWYFFSKIFISTYLGCSLFILYLDIIICDVLYKWDKSFARHWHIYTSTELKIKVMYICSDYRPMSDVGPNDRVSGWRGSAGPVCRLWTDTRGKVSIILWTIYAQISVPPDTPTTIIIVVLRCVFINSKWN